MKRYELTASGFDHDCWMEECSDGEYILYEDVQEMLETLEWYRKWVSDCNRRSVEGERARDILAKDVGQKAQDVIRKFFMEK